MISKYTYKKLTWIDVESPTKEEILHLSEEYTIPQSVSEELLTSTLRSKVDLHDNLIYLILHFPRTLHKDVKDIDQEIDFILGKNFLITVHYELSNPLHEFSKAFEVNALLKKGIRDEHAGFLFFSILKELYHDSTEQLELLNVQMREIEKNIFAREEEKMVQQISHMNRQLLDFKQAIRFHRETLHSFENAGKEFFGSNFDYYLSAIIGEYNKVQAILDGHKEILNDLRETNESLLSAKTNETVKTLTIMSFIMLPLTLISGIFGMNADFVFIHDIPDFIIVIGAMTLTGAIMFLYFKLRKWL
ncbi:MAG: CorA family divalent cation transporter [bacterium]